MKKGSGLSEVLCSFFLFAMSLCLHVLCGVCGVHWLLGWLLAVVYLYLAE